MEVSKAEKLMLMMLVDIHRATVKKGSGEIDPDFVSSVIDFNPWALSWKYTGLLAADEETTEATANEVSSHLSMWRIIEDLYSRMSPSDKKAVQQGYKYGGQPAFAGYDGNNETDHRSAALCIVGSLELFSEFKDRSLNSHAPSVDQYNSMLVKYSQWDTNMKTGRTPISPAQLLEVLNA